MSHTKANIFVQIPKPKRKSKKFAIKNHVYNRKRKRKEISNEKSRLGLSRLEVA
jgi:hypothetical protein